MSTDCSVCRGLDPDIKADLADLAQNRRYAAGAVVVAEDEPAAFLGSVLSGVLRLEKSLPDGRQQIVGLLLPCDMFGEPFTPSSHVSIEAATDAVLCCYERKAFETLMARHPVLEHRFLLSKQKELEVAQEWMLLLGCQTVIERVATFLLILRRRACGRLDDPPAAPARYRVHVPIGRRDMAAYLGTTVESISRALQDMARRGVIAIADPQSFDVLDEARLLRLSGKDESEWSLPSLADRRFG